MNAAYAITVANPKRPATIQRLLRRKVSAIALRTTRMSSDQRTYAALLYVLDR